MKVSIKECDNFSLLFNKLAVLVEIGRDKFYQKVISSNKAENLKVTLLSKLIEIYTYEGKNFANQYVETLKNDNFEVLEFKTQTRLVVGMGIPSFFENGITLHHTYGVPYIPASSVKGLLRFSYLVGCLNIFPLGITDLPKPFEWKNEDLEPEEFLKILSGIEKLLVEAENFEKFSKDVRNNETLKDYLELLHNNEGSLKDFYTTYVELFGNLYQKSKVIYADAIAKSFKFAVDIMNPHFTEYYQSSQNQRKGKDAIYLVADIHNPTPIPFLAVDRGSVFSFAYKSAKDFMKNQLLEELLKEGLSLFGIGGKKRKGYGFLERSNSG